MSLVIFDLETGGLEMHHPIIQIAAVAVSDRFTIIDEFQRKIQFREEDADPKALEVNHYNALTWDREAKPLDTVLKQFANFLEPHKYIDYTSKQGRPYQVARLAAYNAEFDGPRLKKAYKDLGGFLPAEPRVLCIFQLAMWADFTTKGKMPSYKPSEVAGRMGIATDGAHDALADCKIALEVLKKLEPEFYG